VRFRNGHALYGLVFGTVRERLSAENLTARLKPTSTLDAPQAAPAVHEPLPWYDPRVTPASPPPSTPPSAGNGSHTPPPAPAPPPPPPPPPAAAPPPPPAPPPPRPPPPLVTPPPHPPQPEQPPPACPSPSPLTSPPVKAIQLHNAYLVLETAEGMLVIDQHALHERILFEQLKRRIRSGTLEAQPLLIPEPVELTAEQAARALEHQAELADLGLRVEAFGGGTLLLTSYPALLGSPPPHP